MKKKTQTPYDTYNKKRVRLCEFSVTGESARTVEPALQRLANHYGSNVAAITAAIMREDKRLQNKSKK
jgi:hypothetical protein